jgi:hypothetical protein
MVVGVFCSRAVFAQTSTSSASLGTVHLTRAVLANGQPLAAGTYQVRVTGDVPAPVVGQSPEGERWVEFTRGGAVSGKEVATVISSGDIGSIAKGPRPSVGAPRVDVLKGGEYVRVWIVQGGRNYLINLRASAR